jgi:uncharacterized membrane protein YjjB (DUF3815 family)
MDWIAFFEKGIWFGFAAIGFAILFNVPSRTIVTIWFLSAFGGWLKLFLTEFGHNVVLASLGGATLIGILSVFAAKNKQAPPLVFAIPSVIPLVPGVMAYKMMLGLIELAGSSQIQDYDELLYQTVNNGLKVFFILMAISVGVAFPTLISSRSSTRDLNLFERKMKNP